MFRSHRFSGRLLALLLALLLTGLTVRGMIKRYE